jgi:hypothetical protein
MDRSGSDLQALIRGKRPVLNEGVYVYCSVPAAADVSALQIFAMIRENEGITVVLREAAAIAAGLPVLFRAAWITLEVHSNLAALASPRRSPAR